MNTICGVFLLHSHLSIQSDQSDQGDQTMLPQVSLARARAALVLDEGVEHTDNNSFDFTVSDNCRTFLDVKKYHSISYRALHASITHSW